MNLKSISIKILFAIFWGLIFFFTLRYIGLQWEYEGLLTRGLIVGVSFVSSKHIWYSVATVLASGFVASSLVLFMATLFRRNRTVWYQRGLLFSGAAVLIIAVAFVWNRHTISLSKLPVVYRYYDSTGRLIEAEKYTKNLKNVNVILISIDTLNPEHLGAYGYARDTSPTIDSLAEAGVFFENAYSHSPKTSPSHMSLFTSLYPSVHKIRNWNKYQGGYALDHRVVTLPEIMKNVGYHTAAFTGGGNVQSSIGFGHGFDVYHDNDQAWENAFSWLDENHSSKFFLFLHTFKVHSPYLPPPPYNTLFDADYRGDMLDSEEALKAYFHNKSHNGTDFPGSHQLFWELVDKNDPRDIEHVVALYDGGIRFMNDKMMATLIKKLRQYHLLENTLLIFTSDHGEEFLQHGDFLHKELYDEHIQVPLIINFPKADHYQQKVVKNQVSLIDIVPTILEYLSLPVPVMMQGSNLLQMIEGKEIALPVFSERIVISDVPDKKKSIRTLEWKYIWWPTKKVEELYDLVNDPGEQINVAQKYPEIVGGLYRQLLDWINENEQVGQSFGTYTHKFDKATIEKLKSLGYIR